MRCAPLTYALASLLLGCSPSIAVDGLVGPAAAAVEAWIGAGSYHGCFERKACARDPSRSVDLRYSPTEDQALAFVPWSALDGAAGTSVGIFREDNEHWSFVGSGEDQPTGSVRKVLFSGREATFVTCMGDVGKSDTCRRPVVGWVDLGR
jgi:hypothetical protein